MPAGHPLGVTLNVPPGTRPRFWLLCLQATFPYIAMLFLQSLAGLRCYASSLLERFASGLCVILRLLAILPATLCMNSSWFRCRSLLLPGTFALSFVCLSSSHRVLSWRLFAFRFNRSYLQLSLYNVPLRSTVRIFDWPSRIASSGPSLSSPSHFVYSCRYFNIIIYALIGFLRIYRVCVRSGEPACFRVTSSPTASLLLVLPPFSWISLSSSFSFWGSRSSRAFLYSIYVVLSRPCS